MTSIRPYNVAHNRVRGIFFLHGAGFSSWVPHIPMVQERLALSHEQLGIALLAAAVGVIAVMPFAGKCADHFGSSRVVRYAGLAYFPSLIVPLFMGNLVSLSIALFFMGFFAAFLDVAMNANGLNVERAKNKSVMSGLHGFWSLGGFAGAGFATLWFALPLPVMAHLPASALALLILHWVLQRQLMPDAKSGSVENHDAMQKKQRSMFWLLLPFGACAFIGQFGEGVITDWGTVLMTTHLNSGATIAAAGFACYSAAMAITRLSGDWLAMRFGHATVLLCSSAFAACGYVILALAPHFVLAWIGFFLAGTGLAVVLPLLISAAARASGKGGGAVVATIAATGYTAMMAGPPVIGAIGQHFGLVNAFLITALFLSMIIPVYLFSVHGRLKPSTES